MAKRKPFDPLAMARTSPLRVKKIVLNPAWLWNHGKQWAAAPEFPREILACKNLERLEIFRGIDPSGNQEIPSGIGALTKLEHLTLGGLDFTTLPDSIGKLTRLQTLNFVYSESLERLPASIGKLKHLTTLLVDGEAMSTVPASLWKLTRLRVLGLPSSLGRVPGGIGALRELEGLTISAAALASVARELPELRKLRRLSIRGAAERVPDQVGQLRALRDLSVGGLGLTDLPRSLVELRELRALYAADNQLEQLSHLVTALPKLKDVTVYGNPLSAAEKKLVQRLLRLPGSQRPKAYANA